VNGTAPGRKLWAAAAALLAVLTLEGSRILAGSAVSAVSLCESALFVALVLVVARASRPAAMPDGRWRLPAAGVAVAAAGLLGALAAAHYGNAFAAGISIAAFFALSLAAGNVEARPRRRAGKSMRVIALAAGAGVLPLSAVEIESRFAHEEIFVALAALALTLAWLALWLAVTALFPAGPPAPERGLALRPGALGIVAALLAAGGLVGTLARYQDSFSAAAPPAFPGISPDNPFLCGEAPADPETFDGPGVFAALLQRVEAHRPRTPPEEGMLALATGDAARAEAFRSGLLEEVAGEVFSRRGETKYWQYEASLRAYYYPRVSAAFPGLFAPEERRGVGDWFAKINRRALAWDSDDVIYAIAFAKSPEGPYENQENGAGLLALLEAEGLAAPALSPRNRRYLDRARRGWEGRFRNNDDSYGYQAEWINNAFFQSLRSGRAPEAAIRRSFRWLLLQAPPDGFPPDYNAGVPPLLPATAYLGATLLRDPNLLWLSGRGVRSFARRGLALAAQPGVERPVEFPGRSPASGSCLLYADSGLPNRVGPLAPDKIVFRDGWGEDSAYALLNLRFSGWHRYRATNSLVLLRRGEDLVGEKRGQPFSWLPLERRIFRDKRIPREHTNGLLVEPTGFAAATSRLLGFGGPWAQDPPHFARVEAFETGAAADRSATAVSDWRGWSHRRTIVFHHGGPIVVVDEAAGPPARAAAVAWHVSGRAGSGPLRFFLGRASDAELVLLPLQTPGGAVERRPVAGAGGPDLDLLYRPARRGSLGLASVFLMGRWSGARAEFRVGQGGRSLEIQTGGESLSVPLP
jgi:hypothetical protein